jgi:hypothetical protein
MKKQPKRKRQRDRSPREEQQSNLELVGLPTSRLSSINATAKSLACFVFSLRGVSVRGFTFTVGAGVWRDARGRTSPREFEFACLL